LRAGRSGIFSHLGKKPVNNPILGFGNAPAMHKAVAREPHELTKEGTPNITFFGLSCVLAFLGKHEDGET
jgi:hypothetical protein